MKIEQLILQLKKLILHKKNNDQVVELKKNNEFQTK